MSSPALTFLKRLSHDIFVLYLGSILYIREFFFFLSFVLSLFFHPQSIKTIRTDSSVNFPFFVVIDDVTLMTSSQDYLPFDHFSQLQSLRVFLDKA